MGWRFLFYLSKASTSASPIWGLKETHFLSPFTTQKNIRPFSKKVRPNLKKVRLFFNETSQSYYSTFFIKTKTFQKKTKQNEVSHCD
jgi:hypothetical protein